jgi:hypothetical protein
LHRKGIADMTVNTSNTYYLLRSKSTTVGDGPYVGLAEDGSLQLFPEYLQAKRFLSIEEAEKYSGSVKETAGEFEIEVRTTG